MERLADHTDGKNLGQPDSTKLRSSLIQRPSLTYHLQTQPLQVVIHFPLIVEAALFGFPIPYGPKHRD